MRGPAATALLLAFATAALFAPAVGFDFVPYDDPLYVTANPHLAGGLTPAAVRWAFGSHYAGNWHPLTWISHLLDVSLFGLSPAGHHATSVLLHAACAALAFLALRALTGAAAPALLAAALLAVHPLRVESVAWVSERKDVLGLLFGLSTLLAYARFVRRRGAGAYALVLAAFAAGLLSKPTLVTLPGALLLLDWWPLGRFRGAGRAREVRAAVAEKLPLLALAAAAAAATWAAQSAARFVVPLAEAPLAVRLANAPAAWVAYVGKTLAPVGLSCFYPSPPGALPWRTVVGATALLLAVTAGASLGRSRRPHLLAGWLWFLGTLLPVIGLVRAGGQFIADRYTSLPHVGLCVALAWEVRASAARAWRGIATAVVGAALVAALAPLTRTQLLVWRNGWTLFEHADAVTPDNWVVKNNLGTLSLRSGRVEDALRAYREAVRLQPRSAEVRCNLGLVLLRLGRFPEAEEAERAALRLDPTLPEAANALGAALAGQGRWEEAAAARRDALAMRPDYPEAAVGLAQALVRLGRGAEAAAVLEGFDAERLRRILAGR